MGPEERNTITSPPASQEALLRNLEKLEPQKVRKSAQEVTYLYPTEAAQLLEQAEIQTEEYHPLFLSFPPGSKKKERTRKSQ